MAQRAFSSCGGSFYNLVLTRKLDSFIRRLARFGKDKINCSSAIAICAGTGQVHDSFTVLNAYARNYLFAPVSIIAKRKVRSSSGGGDSEIMIWILMFYRSTGSASGGGR